MKVVRKTLFWLHLVSGLAAGGVIAVVAATGALMAFQPQILAWADRSMSQVEPPAGKGERLPIEVLLRRVRDSQPEAFPQGIVLSADPREAAVVSLGRTGPVYVNPYTGEVHPQGSKSFREFFQTVLRVHRWLALGGAARTQESFGGSEDGPAERAGSNSREIGSSIVGGAAIVFFVLSLSGLYLWWPRTLTRRAFKAVTTLNFQLRGKARDWNWHNAIGFWTAPILMIITFTGTVMAFHGFAGWVYPREISTPGSSGTASVAVAPPSAGAVPLTPDALAAAAQKAEPGWKTISLRLQNRGGQGRGMAGRAFRPESAGNPAREGTSVNRGRDGSAPRQGQPRGGRGGLSGENRSTQPAVVAVRTAGWSPLPTTLQLDPYTGEVLRRSGLSTMSFRQTLRALNRSIHTGEAFGVVGQSLAFLGCVGGLFLVYTGFALAWRRFFDRKRAPKLVVVQPAANPPQPAIPPTTRPSPATDVS